MYITFDYKCSACELVVSRMVKRSEQDDQRCECGNIEKMTKLPAGTRTHFRFADTKLKD